VKCGLRVALGVAGGYFLGRTKKMKLAMMLGGMAAGRQAGGPGQLLTQGMKLLGQSPELTRLTDELRGRLLDAGKGAAVGIATRQVENLTERVVNRVGTLTDAGGKTVGDLGAERSGARSATSGRRLAGWAVGSRVSSRVRMSMMSRSLARSPAASRPTWRSLPTTRRAGRPRARRKRKRRLHVASPRVQQRVRPVPAGLAGRLADGRGRGDG
jgi:hypothetical protein